MADKLPGFGKIARRRGRNERSIDDVARYLRSLDEYGPIEAALTAAARTTGAALDRLEHDADRSEHVVGSVARVHLQALDALRPNLVNASDAFDQLLNDLAAARDTPPT